VPAAEAGTATLLVGAPLMDDDGLVGDDVFAHPMTNTVPATTATATNEEGKDIENSFVNRTGGRILLAEATPG